MEEAITFVSNGLRLSGILHLPPAGDRPLPAVIVLHGFGSNKNGGISRISAQYFAALGYVTLRFDMSGCGESEGPRGRVICMEQVTHALDARKFLATRAEVDPQRICVMGFSFGAAVAVYAAGVDNHFAACISVGGWGDGEKKFRKQHESPEAWKRFSEMMARGKGERAKNGTSISVPRFDIVPMSSDLTANLAPGTIMEFPFEVVESMYEFRANDVVGHIAPRPLLLLHAANDTVTPTEQSLDLFRRAGQPTDLHLVAGTDHFLLAEQNVLVTHLVRDWLAKYFPLAATGS